MGRKIKLPSSVAKIYEATKQLNAEYPMRSFTPDGHLVGHLGEVIAAKEFELTPRVSCPAFAKAKPQAWRNMWQWTENGKPARLPMCYTAPSAERFKDIWR